MTISELKARLEALAPGTEAEVIDLTGTQDHYQAVIISPVFEGKLRVEQHRMVYALLAAEMGTEEVHALSLQTLTPTQAGK